MGSIPRRFDNLSPSIDLTRAKPIFSELSIDEANVAYDRLVHANSFAALMDESPPHDSGGSNGDDHVDPASP